MLTMTVPVARAVFDHVLYSSDQESVLTSSVDDFEISTRYYFLHSHILSRQDWSRSRPVTIESGHGYALDDQQGILLVPCRQS
jgi:hypothetical protein